MSIRSRSASGSAIFPNDDSTRQRRARIAVDLSVTAAAPKRIAAAQLRPPSRREDERREDRDDDEPRDVSAFGSCCCSRAVAAGADTLTGYARAERVPAGLRQRALATRFSGRCADERRAATSGRGARPCWTWPRDCPREMSARATWRCIRSCSTTATRRSGSSITSASTTALAAAEAAEEAGIELVLLYAAYAVRAVRPAVRLGVPRRRRAPPRARAHRRCGPPLRPRVPSGLARGDRRLRGARGPRAPRPCLRAAEGGRGLRRSVRRPADRAARAERLPRPAHDRRARHARERRRARPPARRGRHASACARRRKRISATASRRSTASTPAASACASAPTRTCESTRSRSCASSTASHGALTLRRDVVPLERLLAFGSDEGAAALGIEHWPNVTSTPGTRRSRGVDEADVLAALLDGCSAEVLALET